jgi:hypothetical protein
MDCKNFYIVSLPRSRSTWLSHLFTTDDSHCYHSLLSNYDPKGQEGLSEIDKPYVGTCDEWPVSVLLSDKPKGPTVIVKRDLGDCVNSLKKAFDLPDGYPAEEILDTHNKALKILAKRPNTISVNFEDLEDNNTIFRMWSHLLPGVTCLMRRVMQFQSTIIIVKNRDLGPAMDVCAKYLRLTTGAYIKALANGEILKWQQRQ